MIYRVIADFDDLKDGRYQYNVGDIYPAEGRKKPTQARIKELSSNKNRRNMPLIEPVEEYDDQE